MAKYSIPPELLQSPIAELQQAWSIVTGDDLVPPDDVIDGLITEYDFDVCLEAITISAKRFKKGKLDLNQNWVGYIHAVARNIENGSYPTPPSLVRRPL